MSTIEMSVDVCVSHDRSMLGGGGGGGGLTMMQTRCGLDADYHTHPRENGALCVCVCWCMQSASIDYRSNVILHCTNHIWQSVDSLLAGMSSCFI